MEGARGQWSPIDDTLCVVDMRELAVGSNLARKRKSERGRREIDERRSLERKTQHGVEPVEDAGTHARSGAASHSWRNIVNGTPVRVWAGRHAGLVGVATDVGGALVKIELPQPSRLKTLCVAIEQLEVTGRAPAKAGRCTTGAKTPISRKNGKRVWDHFPSLGADESCAVSSADGEGARCHNFLHRQGGFLSTDSPCAISWGSGYCGVARSSCQANAGGLDAAAAGGGGREGRGAEGAYPAGGSNMTLDGYSGDGGDGVASGAVVALLDAPVNVEMTPGRFPGTCVSARPVAHGEGSNGSLFEHNSACGRTTARGIDGRSSHGSSVAGRAGHRRTGSSSSSVHRSSSSCSSCCSDSESGGESGNPCDELLSREERRRRPRRRSLDPGQEKQQRRSPTSDTYGLGYGLSRDDDENDSRGGGLVGGGRGWSHRRNGGSSGGRGDVGGDKQPAVPFLTASQDASAAIKARPPARGTGTTGVSVELGRLWRRPRPPGLTLGVDEVDTEVCAGGLTKASQVLENLWLSGQEVTGDKASLQREGVTHIVNCSVRLANFYPQDFYYHRVSWADEGGQNMELPVLEAAFRHIDAARRQGKACLVHCKAGTSRSCSLVLGYLMQLGEGMSLIAALEFCQAKRRQCNPDKYFLEKLSEYEERLFGQTSVSLDDYHRGDIAGSLVIRNNRVPP